MWWALPTLHIYCPPYYSLLYYFYLLFTIHSLITLLIRAALVDG